MIWDIMRRCVPLALVLAGPAVGSSLGQNIIKADHVRILKGHTHAADGLAFSADSKRLYSGSLQVIKVWDVAEGKDLRTLKGHGQYVKDLAVSRDGKHLISASWDAAVQKEEPCVWIWNLQQDGAPTKILTGDTLVHSVALSPDEKSFATGGREKVVRIWDFPSGKLRAAIDAHPRDVQCVAFSPDSKTLASCGYDSPTKLWDADTGKAKAVISNVGVQFHWDAVAFSPNGKLLAMSGTGLRVINLDAGNQELFNVRPDEVQTTSLCWSPDGKLIATGGMDKVLKIWDATNGNLMAKVEGHKSAIQVVRFSPDGRWIATGAQNDPDIRLWPVVKAAAPEEK